jgi:hypothetical protein
LLQTQLNTLQNSGATQQQAAAQQNVPQATSFALTPATTSLVGLINYSSKLGQSIYKQGCDKLTNEEGFLMTPSTTLVFVKACENRCTIMGWNQGAQNVTKFTNHNAVPVNVVKNYGQIDKATLKAGCNMFCRVGLKCSELRHSKQPHDGTMPQEVTHRGCAHPLQALPEPIPFRRGRVWAPDVQYHYEACDN